MITAFWICAALVVYTYLGYGVLLFIIIRIKRLFCPRAPRPAVGQSPESLPDVSILICAYNEEEVVKDKMANCLAFDYPKEKLHIVWCTDGSDDSTNERLAAYEGVTILHRPDRRGKTAAMNRAMAEIASDIVIMTDANTMVNAGAVKEIVALFMNPKVGCVAGEKRVGGGDDSSTAQAGEGLYWKYESTLKKWDFELYSAMGAAGELCAVRRSLYEHVPEDTLLDDFILSMRMVAKGYRIAYTPDAYALESGSANMEEESKRKRRIAAGGLQSIWHLRTLMNPFRYPVVAFQFVSHRVLRWSVTPFALLALIPINVYLVLSCSQWIYIATWILQILFYAAAYGGFVLDGKGKRNKFLYVPYYFLFMNVNVFRGISYLCSHKGSGVWEKTKRLNEAQ